MKRKPKWVDKLPEAVENSLCYSDVMRYLEMPLKGNGCRRTIQRWVKKLNLDVSHFDPDAVRIAKLKEATERRSLTKEDVFVKNSTVTGATVRRWAKRYIPYQCDKCNNAGIHLGEPLTLQLDHINGDSFDNRIENLRWLCPNCHSQTDTFAGKDKHKRNVKACLDCGKGITKLSLRCGKCAGKMRVSKIKPSKDKLQSLIEEHGNWRYIGKLFGVSDNAVRKWAKSYDLL